MTSIPSPKHGEWFLAEIADIIVPTDRVRKDFGCVKELTDSIAKVGLLHPLVVTKRPDGKYNLNAGESRLRALKLLRHTQAPVTFLEHLSPRMQKEIELEENLRRKNLDWTEEVEALRQLDELKRELLGSIAPGNLDPTTTAWSHKKAAIMLGVSRSGIDNKVRLAETLKDRPDIAARVKSLPMTAATRQVAQILEGERIGRLHASGAIKLSNDLQLGDACELIKKLPPDSVDLVLTDPPFGITELLEAEGKSRGTVQSYTTVLKPADNADAAGVDFLIAALAPELFRVTRPGGHIYMFYAFELHAQLHHSLTKAGFVLNPVPLIWDKGRTTSPFRGYDYSACYEPIIFGYKPPRSRRLTDPCKSILTGHSPDHATIKTHPFQKPQSLLRYFISQSTQIGQVVLDPFAGSGATIIAARALGRSGIGFELDLEHFTKA
ncbi:MAG: ParB N-terminal domain-containing protein, partial [Chloroflexi bacterium]|nr:ParB N-terminal domain-containing protein [Chloroflexota bacterium]